MTETCIRETLPNAKGFKKFWKDRGPFRYALTAADYPPVLLEPEEWLFSNDGVVLLKELMGLSGEKKFVVQAPFNRDKRQVLRPDDMSFWKIRLFPEEWNGLSCGIFVPEGHLTQAVVDRAAELGLKEDSDGIAAAFFHLLEERIEDLGYILLSPSGKSRWAAINAYVREWEEDEADAGIT